MASRPFSVLQFVEKHRCTFVFVRVILTCFDEGNAFLFVTVVTLISIVHVEFLKKKLLYKPFLPRSKQKQGLKNNAI